MRKYCRGKMGQNAIRFAFFVGLLTYQHHRQYAWPRPFGCHRLVLRAPSGGGETFSSTNSQSASTEREGVACMLGGHLLALSPIAGKTYHNTTTTNNNTVSRMIFVSHFPPPFPPRTNVHIIIMLGLLFLRHRLPCERCSFGLLLGVCQG